jgi:hypothetical protein
MCTRSDRRCCQSSTERTIRQRMVKVKETHARKVIGVEGARRSIRRPASLRDDLPSLSSRFGGRIWLGCVDPHHRSEQLPCKSRFSEAHVAPGGGVGQRAVSASISIDQGMPDHRRLTGEAMPRHLARCKIVHSPSAPPSLLTSLPSFLWSGVIRHLRCVQIDEGIPGHPGKSHARITSATK